MNTDRIKIDCVGVRAFLDAISPHKILEHMIYQMLYADDISEYAAVKLLRQLKINSGEWKSE